MYYLAIVITYIIAYRLYTVVPELIKFVDHLTNWYVRMNRRRLKGDTTPEDCKAAVETLFIVIYSMVKVMVSSSCVAHALSCHVNYS